MADDSTEPTTDDPGPETDSDGTGTDDEELGPKGVRALEAMKERVKAAEKEARRAKSLEAELAKLREAQLSESEKAVAAAKAEGIKEGQTAANARALRAEVRAAAAIRGVKPDLAARLIDVADFEIAEDGTPDTEAIGKAVDALVKDNPKLAGARVPSNGTGGGGARQDAPSGASMNDLIRRGAGRT